MCALPVDTTSSRVHERTYILSGSCRPPCNSHPIQVRVVPDPVSHQPVPTMNHHPHGSMASARPSEFAAGRAEFKVGTTPKAAGPMWNAQGPRAGLGSHHQPRWRCERKKVRQGGGNAMGEGFHKEQRTPTIAVGPRSQRALGAQTQTQTQTHTRQAHAIRDVRPSS